MTSQLRKKGDKVLLRVDSEFKEDLIVSKKSRSERPGDGIEKADNDLLDDELEYLYGDVDYSQLDLHLYGPSSTQNLDDKIELSITTEMVQLEENESPVLANSWISNGTSEYSASQLFPAFEDDHNRQTVCEEPPFLLSRCFSQPYPEPSSAVQDRRSLFDNNYEGEVVQIPFIAANNPPVSPLAIPITFSQDYTCYSQLFDQDKQQQQGSSLMKHQESGSVQEVNTQEFKERLEAYFLQPSSPQDFSVMNPSSQQQASSSQTPFEVFDIEQQEPKYQEQKYLILTTEEKEIVDNYGNKLASVQTQEQLLRLMENLVEEGERVENACAALYSNVRKMINYSLRRR